MWIPLIFLSHILVTNKSSSFSFWCVSQSNRITPIKCSSLNTSSVSLQTDASNGCHTFRYRNLNQSFTTYYQGYYFHLSKCSCCHHLFFIYIWIELCVECSKQWINKYGSDIFSGSGRVMKVGIFRCESAWEILPFALVS